MKKEELKAAREQLNNWDRSFMGCNVDDYYNLAIDNVPTMLRTIKGNIMMIERFHDEFEKQEQMIGELSQKQFATFNNDECWIYQGDGDDQLHTLTCPVVISPAVLQALLDNQVGAGPANKDEEGVEHVTKEDTTPVFPTNNYRK